LKIHKENKLCEYKAANPKMTAAHRSVDEAREAAATLGRFIADKMCLRLPTSQKRGMTAKLSIMIVWLGQRVQQPLTAYHD